MILYTGNSEQKRKKQHEVLISPFDLDDLAVAGYQSMR